jgi:hypothetical protein
MELLGVAALTLTRTNPPALNLVDPLSAHDDPL